MVTLGSNEDVSEIEHPNGKPILATRNPVDPSIKLRHQRHISLDENILSQNKKTIEKLVSESSLIPPTPRMTHQMHHSYQ